LRHSARLKSNRLLRDLVNLFGVQASTAQQRVGDQADAALIFTYALACDTAVAAAAVPSASAVPVNGYAA
jgi:hypothetical protein